MTYPAIWVDDKKAQVFEEICALIASGRSLNSILKDPDKHYPVYSTFMGWILKDEELEKKYVRAMECRTEVMVDEIVDISDERPQAYQNQAGAYQVDPAWVSHQKQRVDARKWVAAKLKPKKYGEKMHQEVTGKEGGPIQTESAVTIYIPANKRDTQDGE